MYEKIIEEIVMATFDENPIVDGKPILQDRTGAGWVVVLMEKCFSTAKEAMCEFFKVGEPDYGLFRKDLVQLAAFILTAIESIDRENMGEKNET